MGDPTFLTRLNLQSAYYRRLELIKITAPHRMYGRDLILQYNFLPAIYFVLNFLSLATVSVTRSQKFLIKRPHFAACEYNQNITRL